MQRTGAILLRNVPVLGGKPAYFAASSMISVTADASSNFCLTSPIDFLLRAVMNMFLNLPPRRTAGAI